MMEICVWGSRGSVPVSGARFMRYGGSTTCVEVTLPGASGRTPPRVIVDCGTGLSELGRGWGVRQPEAIVLQTHMHWDHIQGFPFFAPLFDPRARFEFWSVDRGDKGLREVLGGQMCQPTFPVGLDILPAQLQFVSLAEVGAVRLGELEIVWTDVCHPGGSTAYRLSYRGQTVVISGDVEVQAGSRVDLVELATGADLLIMDAQYFPEEYASHRGFGHSTFADAVSVARVAQVAHLALTHHDPAHSDERLDEKLAWAWRLAGRDLMVTNAHDMWRLSVDGRSRARATFTNTAA